MSASFQEFYKRPIFAIKKILRAVGQNASGALTPSEGDAWRPPWVHEGIRERDTVVTCELELYDFFSRDSDALLLLTARPQMPGKSFPTTCIVSVTTNGQTLDAQSVSREVVVKEWVMRARHGEDAAASVVVPVKTIVNLASIIDPGFSESSRVFLTLRFVGCCDAGNMHCIKDVQLEYITPMQRRDPSTSSAHSNERMMRSAEREERRYGELYHSNARWGRKGSHEEAEYVDDGRSSRCGCSRSVERLERLSSSLGRNYDRPFSAGSSEVEVRVDLSPTPMKVEERELGSERRRNHSNLSPSPSSVFGYNNNNNNYGCLSAGRDGFYTERSSAPMSPMLTPPYTASVSVERKSLTPPEMDYNRETMKILASDQSVTSTTTGSQDLYGVPFRRSSKALAPSPAKQQEEVQRPWSALESVQGTLYGSHAGASRSSDYDVQGSSHSRTSRSGFQEDDAEDIEDDERLMTVIRTSPCGTPTTSALHSGHMTGSADGEEPRTPQLQKWSCEAVSPNTGAFFDAGSEDVQSDRARQTSEAADVVYVVTDDDEEDGTAANNNNNNRRSRSGDASRQSVRQMRAQVAKPSATPSSIPSVRSPCSAGVSDEELGNCLAAELLMPQVPARPSSGSLRGNDYTRAGWNSEAKQHERSERGSQEPAQALGRFSSVHEPQSARGAESERSQNRSSSPSVRGSSSVARDDWRFNTAPPKSSFVSVRAMRRSESRRSTLSGPWSAMAQTLGLGTTGGSSGVNAARRHASASGDSRRVNPNGIDIGDDDDDGLFAGKASFTAVGYSEIEAKEQRMKLERAKRHFRSTLGGSSVYCAEDDTLGQVSAVLGVHRQQLLHPNHSTATGAVRKRAESKMQERSATHEGPPRHPMNPTRKMEAPATVNESTPRDAPKAKTPVVAKPPQGKTIPSGYTKTTTTTTIVTPVQRAQVGRRSLDFDDEEGDEETDGGNAGKPLHFSTPAITPTRPPPSLPQQRPPPPVASSPASPVPLAPERTSPRQQPALLHTIRSPLRKVTAAAPAARAADTSRMPQRQPAAKQSAVRRPTTASPDSSTSVSDADDDGYAPQGAAQYSPFAAAGRSFAAAHGWERDAASASDTDERSVATVRELRSPPRKSLRALVRREKHGQLRVSSDDSLDGLADQKAPRGRFAVRAFPPNRTVSSSDEDGYGLRSSDVSDADTDMSLSLVVVEEVSDSNARRGGEVVSVEVVPEDRSAQLRLDQRAQPQMALRHHAAVKDNQRPQIAYKESSAKLDRSSTAAPTQRERVSAAKAEEKRVRPTSTAPPRRPPPSYIASQPQPRLLRASMHRESSDMDSSVVEVSENDHEIAPLPSEPARMAPIPLTGVFLVHKHHASRKGTGRRLLTLQQESDGRVVVSLKKLESKLYKLRIGRGGKKEGENGKEGSVAMTLSPSDDVSLLTGLQAYHSNVIHSDKVRAAECCAVITRRGQLVTAFEVFAERELEPIRSILSSLHRKSSNS